MTTTTPHQLRQRFSLWQGTLNHAAATSSSAPPPSASTSVDRLTPEERPWKRLRERTKCLDCRRLGHWCTSVQAEAGKRGRDAHTLTLPSMAFAALQ